MSSNQEHVSPGTRTTKNKSGSRSHLVAQAPGRRAQSSRRRHGYPTRKKTRSPRTQSAAEAATLARLCERSEAMLIFQERRGPGGARDIKD
jgi:hypothetical protein